MNPSKLQRIYISLFPIPFLTLTTLVAKRTNSFVPQIITTPTFRFDTRRLSSSTFDETEDETIKWERMYEAAGRYDFSVADSQK